MGILNDDKRDAKSLQTTQPTQVTQPKEKQKLAYATPLFEEHKPLWTDDRMMGGTGEKTESRVHDRENTLNVLNGLCHDIFFRAEDVNRDDFKDIPDAAIPVEEKAKKEGSQTAEHKKPLDSKHQNRTYILNDQEEEKPARKPRTRRKPSKRPARKPRAANSSRGKRNTRNTRRRK